MNSELQVVLEPGVAQKLQFAINRNGGSLQDIEYLSTGENFRAINWLRTGRARLVENPGWVIPETAILVDRSIPPRYPENVKDIVYPKLENTGPDGYDVSQIRELFFVERLKGNVMCRIMSDTDVIQTCLRLRDLEEIQRKGSAFLRKHFNGKVFGWGSLVLDFQDTLLIPYLCVEDREAMLKWERVADLDENTVHRFPK